MLLIFLFQISLSRLNVSSVLVIYEISRPFNTLREECYKLLDYYEEYPKLEGDDQYKTITEGLFTIMWS